MAKTTRNPGLLRELPEAEGFLQKTSERDVPWKALGGRLAFEVSSSERDLRDRCALECIPGPIAFGGLLQEGTVREKIERSEGASAPRRKEERCDDWEAPTGT